MDKLLELDGNILLWIQDNLRVEALNPVIKFITHLGDAGLVWIVAIAALLAFRKTRKAGIMCVMALIGSVIINNLILKNLIARTRPYEVVDGLTRLIEKQSDFSFPSGHTGSSIAVGVVMFKELPKKYGIPAITLGILISLSRLYVGVHYPTDVIVGAIAGAFSAIISIRLYTYYENKKGLKSGERVE